MTSSFAADTGATAHVIVAELGDVVVVTGDAGHHLATVRRLQPGEHVTAADGAGRWRLYEVARPERQRLELRALDDVVEEPSPATRIALAFAPTKGGQPERVVQHATELGVDHLHPLVTERTVVRWDATRERGARERLDRIARKAATQSFRSRLPELGRSLTVPELAELDGVVVADRGGPCLPELGGATWILAVGPEGGFSPSELALLGNRPRLGLGAFVLRSETAVLTGCTLLVTLRDRCGQST